MARLIAAPTSNENRSFIDHTLPFNCTIESCYVTDGHGEYAIRVIRLFADPLATHLIRKRFRQFVELNEKLKEYGYQFEFPGKKFFGNKNPTFLAERQKHLQTFLNVLVQHGELCKSLLVQKFLIPESQMKNYFELALQHVSMFIRSNNNNYEIIEPLIDFGWRPEKNYFLVAKSGRPKEERYLLIWTHNGPDRILKEKEILHCLKCLKLIRHPSFVPLEDVYANENGILTVYRFYPHGSLKDFFHQTRPADGVFWRRYGPTSSRRKFPLDQIKIIARQILQSLQFVHENHLIYAHLHSGNLLIDCESSPVVQLLDICNVIAGVSSKFRSHYVTLKSANTFEKSDIYAFARLLYELSTGEECPSHIASTLPLMIPVPIREILERIFFSTDSSITVENLLNEPFFNDSDVLHRTNRCSVRLNEKFKQCYEQIHQFSQEHLESDRHRIKNAQRHQKVSEHLMSDEEKSKRRRERQSKKSEQKLDSTQISPDISKNLLRVMPIDTPPSSISNGSLLKQNFSTQENNESRISSGSMIDADRNRLLNSISDFQTSRLRKAVTNDRSAPKLV